MTRVVFDILARRIFTNNANTYILIQNTNTNTNTSRVKSECALTTKTMVEFHNVELVCVFLSKQIQIHKYKMGKSPGWNSIPTQFVFFNIEYLF